MVATLRREKDEVQKSARIWERDLLILCRDHCHLQASFNRLILWFTDLQARIQEDHPKFQIGGCQIVNRRVENSMVDARIPYVTEVKISRIFHSLKKFMCHFRMTTKKVI
jgi:hypothetical protein